MFTTSQVNKLVELYKESSKEWSKKAGELEGVIKALEVNCSANLVPFKTWKCGLFVLLF